MPGFPDKFMPFMDEPPGAKLSSKGSAIYGMAVKRLRGLTMDTLDKEPRWRTRGRELKTGFTKTW
jgi:hydrogenase small subunit